MSAPTAATTYRRPQQAAAFWSVTQSQWDIWVDDAAHAPTPAQRKAASQNLRKFDAAGRIMETFEGIDAVSACSWCSRSGALSERCRLYVNRKEACAFCKVKGKQGCSASTVAVAVAGPVGSSSSSSSADVAADATAITAITTPMLERLDMLERKVERLERSLERTSGGLTALKDKVTTSFELYKFWLTWLIGESNGVAREIWQLWETLAPGSRAEPVETDASGLV